MLDYLGERDAGAAIAAAINRAPADPKVPRTADIGGRASTVEAGKAIAALLCSARRRRRSRRSRPRAHRGGTARCFQEESGI